MLLCMAYVRPFSETLTRRPMDFPEATIPNKSLLRLVKKVARLRRLGPGERCIFYCNLSSRDGREKVAKVFGCPYYYSIVGGKDAVIEK